MPAGGIRIDTGVYEGAEISMFYDSMICKLIAYGTDRGDAIAKMREALNGFIVRGVSSNIPFQSALLAHPRFVSGQFDTGFIAEEYPEGFSSASMQHPDPGFLVALAAALHRHDLERAASLSGQLPGHEVTIGQAFVVLAASAAGGSRYTPVGVFPSGDGVEVAVEGRRYRIALDHPLGRFVVRGRCDGTAFQAQLERPGLGYRLRHDGAELEARVLSPRAAELHALMPVKPKPDLSKFLLSPMPGLLVDVAVTPGQAVRAGERLAVIEAMKMENILLAAQDHVVARVVAVKGGTLAVDEVILEFE
jgi:propionyl-CoA carboxylase alpha chain